MGTPQTRFDCALEIKALSRREFEGYGSTFGNVDLGDEIVVPGAFKKSLAVHTKAGTVPQMFWMHQPDRVPGAWSEMHEDEDGLYVRGQLADTELGNEMHALLQMKAVRGLSIGFQTVAWDYDKRGKRLLKEVDLWEVSLVSLAMNPLAKVEAVKSRLSREGVYVPTPREVEIMLREANLSNSAAKSIVSLLFNKSAGMVDSLPRDVGDVDTSTEGAEILRALNGTVSQFLGEAFKA